MLISIRIRRNFILSLILLISAGVAGMIYSQRSSAKNDSKKQQNVVNLSEDGALTSCVTPPTGLVSWWSGEGNANDVLGINNGIIQGGTTFAPGKVGQAFNFGGAGDFVQVPDSASLDVNTFTIDAWIKQGTAANARIVDKITESGQDGYLLDIVGGKLRLIKGSVGVIGVTTIAPGVWTHVAGTFDGTNMTVYVNGNVDQTDANGGATPVNTLNLRIGADQNGNSNFAGMIDEVDVFNRALSASEIQAIYNADSAGKCLSCTPLPANAVSWWTGNGNANDVIGMNNGTLQNGTTFAQGKVGQAFSLDGVDDYVEIPDSPSFSFTSGEISAEAWIKPTSDTPYTNEAVISQYHSTSSQPSSFFLGLVNSGRRVEFGVFQSNNPVVYRFAISTQTIPLNEYTHIAATLSVASQQVKIYINGVETPTTLDPGSQTVNSIADVSIPVRIGAVNPHSVPEYLYQFPGLIDEPTIYNRALSASEIQAIYNAGSAGKCGAQPVLPVNYEMLNGEVGSFTYFDDTYNGTGNRNVALAPLTGGTGDLTDGVTVPTNWDTTPGPYVGWNSIHPTINFNFAGTVNINAVTIHVDSSNNGGVSLPENVQISMGGVTRSFSIPSDSNPVPRSIRFPGLNLTGNSLSLTLNRRTLWVMVDEVSFEENTIGNNLSLLLNPTTVNGGQASTGTVTLSNPAPDGGATISLNSSNTTAATVPASITIPQGATSGTFTVSTTTVTNESTVNITAAYQGETRTATLNVLAPRPDLRVAVNPPATANTDATFNLTWSDRNEGLSTATGTWTDKVYISPDNQVGNDILLGDFSFTGTLAPNQSVDRIQGVSIPRSAVPTNGTYYLIVVTDANNNIDEGQNENNNADIKPLTVTRTPRPDLTVSNIQAPNEAFFDQTISVQWTVLNGGDGATNAVEWGDRVFLSLDTTVSNDDIALNSVTNITSLNVGESYVATAAEVRIPRGTFGNYFVLVKTDNGNSVIEDNENNNTGSKTINLRVPPLPDLRVGLVQAPEEVFTGSTITLNWRVDNTGDRSTAPQTSWIDSVYLSQDTTLSTGTDRLIGSRQRQGALNQNESYTASNVTFNVPPDIAGDWYVFVLTDAQNNVYEFVNENNNDNYDRENPGSPVHIRATPPDLIIQGQITAPTDGQAARQITVNWTVQNQGAFDAAPNWFDTVYLSADQTLDTATDTPLATIFRSSPLAAGATYSASANVTLPACINGTYYLFVFTDSRRQIFEYDPKTNAEANNNNPAKAINIVNLPPDLQLTSIGNPIVGTAGQPVSIAWTVTNAGTGPTLETSWFDRIYFSPTATLNLNTALLAATFTHDGALANGASYSRTENVIVPTSAQGNYFIFVITDANDNVEECGGDGNNTASSPTQLNVTNALPDMTITNITAPPTALPGQSIMVNWTGANSGTATAQNPAWNDAVYLSTNATLDSGDTRLNTTLVNGPLNTGATYNAQAQVTLPNVPAGNYFLIVQSDADNFVFEGGFETNNTRSQAIPILIPGVDLQVTNVDSPTSGIAGQTIAVNWTVTNTGMDATIGNFWTDYVYLSLDQILDPTDRALGFVPHTGVLAGGANYNEMLTAEIPVGFSGPYYVIVQTDRNNLIGESSDANNSSVPRPIALSLAPPSDLTITSITPPVNASPGEQATFQWTVQNVGVNSATGTWTDNVYLSTDPTWDIDDPLVGKLNDIGPLNPNESRLRTMTVTLPAVNPGQYYVIIRTDARNRVRESDESNNQTTATNTTIVDVAELQIGVPRNTTLVTGQERYYKTNAPANETLRFSLDGQNGSFNELYTRFDFIPNRSAYDYFFSRPYEADQETIVPNTQTGNYFNLARSEYVPPANSITGDKEKSKEKQNSPSSVATQNVTIKAEIIPFSITSVAPNRIGDNGQVTITIKGARFDSNATVKLVQGTTVLNAARMIFVDAATVKARFLFTNAPHGVYDVVLTNPNNQVTMATQAVSIETATRMLFDTQSITNQFPILGRTANWSGVITNTGNVDIQYLTFVVNTDTSLEVTMVRTPDSLPRSTYIPTNTTSRNLIFRDISPNEKRPVSFVIRNYQNAFDVGVLPIVQSKEEFVSDNQAVVEAARQQFLNSPTQLPPQFASAINDSMAWWNLFKAQYINTGLIDDESTISQLAEKKARKLLFRKGEETLNELGQNSNCEQIAADEYNDCKVAAYNAFLSNLRLAFAAYFVALLSGNPVIIAAAPDILLLAIATSEVAYVWELAYCFSDYKARLCSCENDDPIPCGISFSSCPPFVRRRYCPVRPSDPNDKEGSSGYGTEKFVGQQMPLPYVVNFENVATATATAQRIRVTDQLDTNLDWRTFRLKEIGFGQYRVQIPDNRAFFNQRIQLGAEFNNLLADISAGVDIATGRVTWTLQAIDPTTGEPPNSANLGLLPPNNAANDGQGFVSYTVQPKSTATTGAVINNNATIIFDTEEPITTNTVSNTLDADLPTSAVNILPPSQSQTDIALSWTGSDAKGGSGVQSYDIWVSENSAPYQPFLSGTTETSAQFTGQRGTTYRFYSIARDNAGNVEAAPTTPDATTTVSASVTVGGQVFTADGRGIAQAIVTLTNSNGITRSARTNSFGYYRFDAVVAGENYVIDIRHKGYSFTPQIVTVNNDISDLNFVANKLLAFNYKILPFFN